jgi:hypothetical protein
MHTKKYQIINCKTNKVINSFNSRKLAVRYCNKLDIDCNLLDIKRLKD